MEKFAINNWILKRVSDGSKYRTEVPGSVLYTLQRQFYDNEIPKILKYSFGLGETATGVVMALDNVFALFLLPLFGNLSDKTDCRIGKRILFLLVGFLHLTDHEL